MRIPALPSALAACLLCMAAAAQQPAAPAATPAPAVTPAPRVGTEYTPGWDMMTAKERDAYRQRMLAAPTPDECRRMRDEQIKAAAAGARNRGIKDVPNPKAEACPE